jgi:hypothetical protein
MPRNSWRSLVDADVVPVEPVLPPELIALQAERAALGARMARLTGHAPEENGDDASRRFPVTPLAVRRAADEAWARSRDRPAGTAVAHPALRPLAGRATESAGATPGTEEREPAARTGQRLIRAPLERALAGPPGVRPPPAVRDRMARERTGRDSGSGNGPAAPDPSEQYEARRERLLSVITGGSGDPDARLARARAAARRLQAADDARVARARSAEEQP